MKIMWVEMASSEYITEVEGAPELGTVHQGSELIAVTVGLEGPRIEPGGCYVPVTQYGAAYITAEEWPMLRARIDAAFKGQDPNTIVETLESKGLAP